MKLTLSLLALTAVNHGGALELKLENADFVIIGKIGNNQQKTITKNALVTLTEAEFKVSNYKPELIIESMQTRYVNAIRLLSVTNVLYYRNGSRPATRLLNSPNLYDRRISYIVRLPITTTIAKKGVTEVYADRGV